MNKDVEIVIQDYINKHIGSNEVILKGLSVELVYAEFWRRLNALPNGSSLTKNCHGEWVGGLHDGKEWRTCWQLFIRPEDALADLERANKDWNK